MEKHKSMNGTSAQNNKEDPQLVFDIMLNFVRLEFILIYFQSFIDLGHGSNEETHLGNL